MRFCTSNKLLGEATAAGADLCLAGAPESSRRPCRFCQPVSCGEQAGPDLERPEGAGSFLRRPGEGAGRRDKRLASLAQSSGKANLRGDERRAWGGRAVRVSLARTLPDTGCHPTSNSLVAAAQVGVSIPGGCLTGGEGLATWLVATVIFCYVLIWRYLGPG